MCCTVYIQENSSRLKVSLTWYGVNLKFSLRNTNTNMFFCFLVLFVVVVDFLFGLTCLLNNTQLSQVQVQQQN